MKVRIKTMEEMKDLHIVTEEGYGSRLWSMFKYKNKHDTSSTQTYPTEILGNVFKAEHLFEDNSCRIIYESLTLYIENGHYVRYEDELIKLPEDLFDI